MRRHAVLLAAALTVTLAACGSPEQEPESSGGITWDAEAQQYVMEEEIASGEAALTVWFEEETLAEAVRRARAYLEVGAPVVFIPRLAQREHVEAVVSELGRGVVTLISIPGVSLPARELEQLGVARLSTGPFTQRVALTALQDATAELLAGGVLPPGTRALN